MSENYTSLYFGPIYDRKFFEELSIDSLMYHFYGTNSAGKDKAMVFFEDQKLIPAWPNDESPTVFCDKCTVQCRPQKVEKMKTGWTYVCRSCKHRIAPLKNGFFWVETSDGKGRASSLSWYKSLASMFWFICELPPTKAIEHLKVGEHTEVDWSAFCKEVCTFKFRLEMGPIGGDGLHVELDESFLHERKYGKGRQIGLQPKQVKLFGGICRETGEAFMLLVPSCKEQDIWPLIKHFVRPKSVVHTDGAAIYETICREKGLNYGFRFKHHERVIHKTGEYVRESTVEFGEKVTTNRIENTWRWIKERVTMNNGTEGIERDIYTYLYRRRFLLFEKRKKGKIGLAFNIFLQHVKEFFPANPFMSTAELNAVKAKRVITPRFYDELCSPSLAIVEQM